MTTGLGRPCEAWAFARPPRLAGQQSFREGGARKGHLAVQQAGVQFVARLQLDPTRAASPKERRGQAEAAEARHGLGHHLAATTRVGVEPTALGRQLRPACPGADQSCPTGPDKFAGLRPCALVEILRPCRPARERQPHLAQRDRGKPCEHRQFDHRDSQGRGQHDT